MNKNNRLHSAQILKLKWDYTSVNTYIISKYSWLLKNILKEETYDQAYCYYYYLENNFSVKNN